MVTRSAVAVEVGDWRWDWRRVFIVLAGWVRTWATERDTAPETMFSQKRRPRGWGIMVGFAPPRTCVVGFGGVAVVAVAVDFIVVGEMVRMLELATVDDIVSSQRLLRGEKAPPMPIPMPVPIPTFVDVEAPDRRCDIGDGNMVFTDRSPTEIALKFRDEEDASTPLTNALYQEDDGNDDNSSSATPIPPDSDDSMPWW